MFVMFIVMFVIFVMFVLFEYNKLFYKPQIEKLINLIHTKLEIIYLGLNRKIYLGTQITTK